MSCVRYLRFVGSTACCVAFIACTRKQSRRLDSVPAVQPATRAGAALSVRARDSIADTSGIGSSSDKRPVLTPPAELAQLPSWVRDTLTTRGCLVLQQRGDSARNVLRGAFIEQDGADWAVLCARGADGRILVFARGGGSPVELPVIGGPIPDVNAPPKPADPFAYGCPPSISVITAAEMRAAVSIGTIINADDTGSDTLQASERRLPAHDGINSADCEGVSNIYYWTGRRWVRFSGAD